MRKALSRRLERMERSLARGAACERCGYRPGEEVREVTIINDSPPVRHIDELEEYRKLGNEYCEKCGRLTLIRLKPPPRIRPDEE